MAKAQATVDAHNAWQRFTEKEKAIVRFGMIPHWCEAEYCLSGDAGRLFAVALFQCAKDDGGMIA